MERVIRGENATAPTGGGGQTRRQIYGKHRPVIKTDAGSVCGGFSSAFAVKVKLQPTLNYADSRQGDHYVTSATPPSAGEIIARSSV